MVLQCVHVLLLYHFMCFISFFLYHCKLSMWSQMPSLCKLILATGSHNYYKYNYGQKQAFIREHKGLTVRLS